VRPVSHASVECQWNNEEKAFVENVEAAGVARREELDAAHRCGVPGSVKLRVRVEEGVIRLWPGSRIDDLSKLRAGLTFVAIQKRSELGRTCHRRREADRFEVGRQRAQAREIERQEIARLVEAIACSSSMMTVRSSQHRDATA